MRTTSWLTAAGCFLLATTPLYADTAANAKTVVAKAIKALGGQEKLAKTPATTFKCKSTVDEDGGKGEFSGTWSVQLPDKYRAELELVKNGRTDGVTVVINGDKGWAKKDNQVVAEAPPAAISVIKADFGAIQLAHYLVPLTDKNADLSHLGEMKIDNRAAVGIKVKRKDLPDIDLFFDQETSLPVKAEIRVKEEKGGEDKLHTFLFQNYKETDGVKHFTKLTLRRDDKETMVMELSEVKRLEKLDATLFEKP